MNNRGSIVRRMIQSQILQFFSYTFFLALGTWGEPRSEVSLRRINLGGDQRGSEKVLGVQHAGDCTDLNVRYVGLPTNMVHRSLICIQNHICQAM